MFSFHSSRRYGNVAQILQNTFKTWLKSLAKTNMLLTTLRSIYLNFLFCFIFLFIFNRCFIIEVLTLLTLEVQQFIIKNQCLSNLFVYPHCFVTRTFIRILKRQQIRTFFFFYFPFEYFLSVYLFVVVLILDICLTRLCLYKQAIRGVY